MGDEEPDVDGLAHRIVQETTADEIRECSRCGGQMEKYVERAPTRSFGRDEPVARRTRTFYLCPDCGEDTRLSS
jgi:uncharacterized protein with PIN domain